MIYQITPNTAETFKGFAGWRYPQSSRFDCLDLYIKNELSISVDDFFAPDCVGVSSLINPGGLMPPILMKSRGTWIVSEAFKDYICKIDCENHVFRKINVFCDAKLVAHGYWLFVLSSVDIPFDFERTKWSGGHRGEAGAEKARFSAFGDIHLLSRPHTSAELFRGCKYSTLMAPYFCTEKFLRDMPDEVRAGLDFKCCFIDGKRMKDD